MIHSHMHGHSVSASTPNE